MSIHQIPYSLQIKHFLRLESEVKCYEVKDYLVMEGKNSIVETALSYYYVSKKKNYTGRNWMSGLVSLRNLYHLSVIVLMVFDRVLTVNSIH